MKYHELIDHVLNVRQQITNINDTIVAIEISTILKDIFGVMLNAAIYINQQPYTSIELSHFNLFESYKGKAGIPLIHFIVQTVGVANILQCHERLSPLLNKVKNLKKEDLELIYSILRS